MGVNPYDSPATTTMRSDTLKFLLRMALGATFPLLALSFMVFAALGHGAVFSTEFTIENQCAQTIIVTPVGSVGGARDPLPMQICSFPVLYASQRGGYEIPPGAQVDLIYNDDDIRFSEIVVHDGKGERGQVVVADGLTEDRFVVDSLDALEVVTADVRRAAAEAQQPTSGPWPMLTLLLGPWLLFIVFYLSTHGVK